MTALRAVADEPTLGDLATLANAEAQLAFEAGTAMIQHAINAGEALLAAKKRVDDGAWLEWLTANFERSMSVAQQCMRIARHKELVIEAQATNFKGALRLLHGEADSRYDPALKAEVQRLKSQGLSHRKIAAEVGVHLSTVSRWLNPAGERRRLDRAKRLTIAGRRALNREKRDAEVKRAGGSAAEAYSLIRKALQALEQASQEQTDREVRQHISDATNRLYNAEDAIVKAVRLYA